MKAVILAAGEGTRMRPLTRDTPKPLLPVAGKPIIEHNIELIKDKVDEVVIVAGYMIEEFEKLYGEKSGIKIVEQDKAQGTADAALQAKEEVDGRTLILNGDDIYGESVREVLDNDSAILAKKADKPENFGVFDIEDGEIIDVEEKPDNPKSDMVNIGCYFVEERFFELLEKVEKSERGEYEITDALNQYIEDEEVRCVEADRWLPCSYPWQLIEANEVLLPEQINETSIGGDVADSAEIKGKVIIEEGAKIDSNSVIEGPAVVKSGCEVGPGAYIRPRTVLEEDVDVGKSEVKNSIIGEKTGIPHFNYIGDSYIGKKVNLGAGAKTANLRNDSENVKMKVKGEMYDTGRKKLGSIIASEVKIGVNSTIKPGRKIGFRAATDSNEKVTQNIADNTLLKDGETIEDWR
ncbi:MAG: NTP transferase domain-containing protein [Nanohaloarchaea archaeon]|nr:NTP transferase domain-containing protein [Candidatus Nanohaloarchaea archaeon]